MTTLVLGPNEPVTPSAADVELARESGRRLAAQLSTANGTMELSITDSGCMGDAVAIPTSAIRLLVTILTEMASGNAVRLIPHQAELTTQEAAELLNVSRPYLIRLLNENRIPFHRVGTHRRVLFKDVMAYKNEHRRARKRTLDRLSALDQELGLT